MRVKTTVIVLLLSLILGCDAAPQTAQQVQLQQRCFSALQQGYGSHAIDSLPRTLDLAVWNIHKTDDSGWAEQLTALSANSHLVLLQEAVDSDALQAVLGDRYALSFAPGYRRDEQLTGVLTASTSKPLASCYLSATEPLLRSPKATAINLYRIQGEREPLLVINLHGVNFSLGIEALATQLKPIVDIARQHSGAMIMAGDFNTWNHARRQLVDAITQQLWLKEVRFTNDKRKHFLGSALDHIYIRGFTVLSSDSPQTSSSDHNPLITSLQLQSQTVSRTYPAAAQ